MKPITEHHWPADAASIIDYYRADQRRLLIRTWVSSLTLLYLGCGLALVTVVAQVSSREGALALRIAGLVAFVLGLWCVVRGLWGGLRAERYVSLRRDGLIVRLATVPLLIEWDELEDVCHDADLACVRLFLRSGEQVELTERYMDVDARALAKRILTVRRRALWGYNDALVL